MIFNLDKDKIPSEILSADLCIIGSGVAGLVIANEWFGSDLNVVLIESGGGQFDETIQSLYEAQSIGVPYVGALLGRFRVFGGSSTRWGAQLLPFNPEDFNRPWINGGEWPLTYEVLKPYYARALSIMGANHLPYLGSELRGIFREIPEALDSSIFRVRYSKFAPFNRRNLAKTLEKKLKKSKNVHVVLHASVTQLNFNKEKNRVVSIVVDSPGGVRECVGFKRLILAAGTLESTRLLLAGAPEQFPEGIGNQNDCLGRYFQDHVSFRAGPVIPLNITVFKALISSYFRKWTRHWPRFEIEPKIQETQRLLNVFGHIGFEYPETAFITKLRTALRAFQMRKFPAFSFSDLGSLCRESFYFLKMLKCVFWGGRFPFMSGVKFFLQVDTEQMPNPESRLTLSEVRDTLGMPKLVINWQLTDAETRGITWYCRQFQTQLREKNIAEVVLDDRVMQSADQLHNIADIYHPAGTTRMHIDPLKGVVDANLCVHGIANLYVASCSVFPSSAGANPTFTLMALALRLCDFLKKQDHNE